MMLGQRLELLALSKRRIPAEKRSRKIQMCRPRFAGDTVKTVSPFTIGMPLSQKIKARNKVESGRHGKVCLLERGC